MLADLSQRNDAISKCRFLLIREPRDFPRRCRRLCMQLLTLFAGGLLLTLKLLLLLLRLLRFCISGPQPHLYDGLYLCGNTREER